MLSKLKSLVKKMLRRNKAPQAVSASAEPTTSSIARVRAAVIAVEREEEKRRLAEIGWLADRITIMQLMWGEGWHLPEGPVLANVMTKPFALTKDMTLLDLNVGFGGATRATVGEYKIYADGLEPDEEIAAAGMEMARVKGMEKNARVRPYPLQTFRKTTHHYDCIVMRELIFRVENKQQFVETLGACFKPRGQMAWTDYCVPDAERAKPAIATWLTQDVEKPQPMAFDAALKFWEKNGYDVRVHEDRTVEYMRAIKRGLAGLVRFAAQQPKIATATKPILMAQVELWATRYMAFQAGLKFYRFYALKK